ncbi:hypothetical protein EJ05DRAFT_480561 [Pseudovirgaria hyperparasitica]|uniref:BAH-domain-containing protein n=1 Tax=Pseudovirgaria hyperparasitica TaxID=470096 RepID=A0A6A6VR97_9PEZI|nr:uncharacterized protein EJ05DRAFT_480561 [Pseudovirgaria hyperparasitica]KAF2753198.1 hypothetical protein EJ05DRAFT_480561 [Pseudovirgaria hyperparasitica]
MASPATREDAMQHDTVQPADESATGTSGVSSASLPNHPSTSSNPTATTSVAQPSTDSPHPAAINNNPPTAESTSTPDQPAQSQPMTTSNSTSSNASAKQSKDSNMAATSTTTTTTNTTNTTAAAAAAPYGTRSRGTRNVARPNYAEDADLMDFELTQPAKNGTAPSESGVKSSANSETQDSPTVASRKANANGTANGAFTSVNDAKKDAPVAGTLTFSTTATTTTTNSSTPAPAPAPAPSKRRKAQANHAASNGSLATSTAGTQSSSRRTSHQIAAVAQPSRQSNMYTFEKSKAMLKNGKLEADDGTVFNVNDHVYLICEPPGEPYYLCRLMEFVRDESNDPNSPIVSIRVNWFYRPRDVQRFNNDTRLVYGTMHSDICPLTSLRGKCQIKHRAEIGDVDEYRKIPDSFWFNQAFDRFIHRWYEVIPTKQVINVPEKVKKALDERWKYVVVETSRVKELTSEVKTCKRCTGYCPNPESVECAVCHNTYHMNCVRPPLLKKPSRGFAWACGPCSRAQERKLEARRTPIIGEASHEAEEDEQMEEEEEDGVGLAKTADSTTAAPSPTGYEAPADLHPATQAEIALAQMWPMRYLGIHARVEDALQYDDRAIYPRASSRLGPRHQANVNVWHGHPVEFVKPAEIKRRYVKAGGQKKDTKLSKETVAALEADRQEKAKRPKWVQDEPQGYVRRGEDLPNKDSKNSAKLMFRMPPPQPVHSERGNDDVPAAAAAAAATEADLDAYMHRVKTQVAPIIGVEKWNTNFLDKALELYTTNNYNADAAIRQLKKVDRKKDLKEPELTKEEIKKFGEGVAKYGSELRNVRLHVKTITPGEAVRYYYLWKKREGKEIWKNYGGRKGRTKKPDSEATAKLLDDVAHDQDDSAFDCEKAERRKRGFQCKFCNIRHSRQWRRAPNAAPGQTVLADGRSKEKGQSLVVALCQRCANLWRRYAIKWENIDEIAKKIAMGGLKATKRRIDEELINEFNFAKNNPHAMDIDPPVEHETVAEPPKKRLKVAALDKDRDGHSSASESNVKKKQQQQQQPRQQFIQQPPPPPPPPPKQPTPPPVPAQPKMATLPCCVCYQYDLENDRLMTCNECRLTVHRKCFGVDSRRTNKWTCDMCRNDRKTHVSYAYECVLCPVTLNNIDLVEPPKVSHKKKTDRDRERERMEKELAANLAASYRQQQRDKGRPELPREPLKRTSDGNWVHVYCAAWVPETRFNDPKSLDIIEGIGSVALRYEQTCKVCKTDKGACVSCHQPGCNALFHVGCAHQAGYIFGFDVAPVKGSRRDVNPVFTLGADKAETGALNPAIWCREHAAPKTIVHPITEIVNDTPNLTALQVYVRNYKEADSSTTGPARKAALMDQSVLSNSLSAANRRTSAVQGGNATAGRGSRRMSSGDALKTEDDEHAPTMDRHCTKCKVEVSPKWWVANERTLQKEPERPATANGISPYDISTREYSATVGKPTVWLCNKCHWKKRNAVEETEERPPSRPEAIRPEVPVTMPLRSPTTIPYPAPTPWNQPGGPIAQPAPPLSSWAGNHPSSAPTLSNGVTSHSPRAHTHPATYHAPPPLHHSHQTNGYHPPNMHPVGIPPPYGTAHPSHAPLAPMHAPNGHHSPRHLQLHSPTHPPPHQGFPPPPPPPPPSRHTSSPYAPGPSGPPQHLPAAFGSHHQSPPLSAAHPHHHRPTTPRTRENTLPPLPAERPMPSGASASPSLRNLLH